MKDIDGDALGELCMLPHLMEDYIKNERFPIVEAAEGWDEFEVETLDAPNYLEMAGNVIAEEIQEEARRLGRRRIVPKRNDEASTGARGEHGCGHHGSPPSGAQCRVPIDEPGKAKR